MHSIREFAIEEQIERGERVCNLRSFRADLDFSLARWFLDTVACSLCGQVALKCLIFPFGRGRLCIFVFKEV